MRTRELHWIEMENRSPCNPDTTSSSSTSGPRSFSYNTNVESFRPIQQRGKIVIVWIKLDVFSVVFYCINPRLPLFLSFVVAQVYSPSLNYIPTAPMTDLSIVEPSSSSNIFNYDTPPPSYDQVYNQASRGSKSLHNVPTDSTSKFHELK